MKYRTCCRSGPLALLLISAALCACRAAGATPSDGSEEAARSVVQTTGEAVIERAADRAFLTIATETRSKNARVAQRENARAMSAVRRRLAEVGVQDDAVRALAYELQREYDYVGQREVFREYVIRNTIETRLDEVGRIGEAIDAAVAGGATSVDGPRFDVADRDAIEREALQRAAADARAKADAAAAGAGGTIARVTEVEEQDILQPSPRQSFGLSARSESAPPTPIAPGRIAVRAKVRITAALK